MCARESFTWLMCKCLQTSDRSVQRARLMVPALRQNFHNHQFTTLCPSTDPHPNPNWLAGDLQQHWYMEPCKARKIRAQKSHNCKTSPNFHDCREKTSATWLFFQHQSRSRQDTRRFRGGTPFEDESPGRTWPWEILISNLLWENHLSFVGKPSIKFYK